MAEEDLFGKQDRQKTLKLAMEMEAEEADKADSLGFMARAMAQASIPHSEVEGPEFYRSNGDFQLSILAPSTIGLPYGSKPRILIAWVTTEAVRTQSRNLELGQSLSEFMRKLGYQGKASGGENGNIHPTKDQMKRLFSSAITCTMDSPKKGYFGVQNVQMVSEAYLWWNPKKPEQMTLWKSTLTLGADFFDEVTTRPVPIDMRAYRALRDSPMCLDIYTWLTYRMSYLRKRTVVPWEALEAQFGANYADSKNFRAAFRKQMRRVLAVYHEAKLTEADRGIELRPSPPHVRQIAVDKPGES